MGYIYSAVKKVGYKVLDLVTMGNGVPTRINGIRLKLPTKYFRLFPSDYERPGFEFFKKHLKPGDTILDIGAHIGLYAVFFSKLTNGKVYSFEPTPSTADVLRKTIAINNCNKNVTVVQAAVSEEPGVATFYSSDVDVATGNSLVDVDFGEDVIRKGAYQVNVLSVDHFRKQQGITINALKIDAEGVELEVLNGARETFLQDRPVAMLGLHPFAYENRAGMLGIIWDKLKEYKMEVRMNAQTITKDEFCSNKDFVFDVELLPQ